jgi:hypothetical protein
MPNRLTSGMSALGDAQSFDPFAQVKTVFSGADPAIADLAGTSAIMQGTYPASSNQAYATSWLGANPWTTSTPSASLASGSGTTASVPQVGTMTTIVVFVIAIILLMAGAFALVGPEVSSATGG